MRPAPERKPETNGGRGPRTILVVEPDPVVAELLSEVLAPPRFVCLIADHPAEAERVLESHDVSAVVIDPALPKAVGLSWLESLAERRPELCRLTIVFSGIPLSDDDLRRIRHLGAGYLPKPASGSQLLAALAARKLRVTPELRSGQPVPAGRSDSAIQRL